MQHKKTLLTIFLLFVLTVIHSQEDLFTAIEPYANGEMKFLYAGFSENKDGTGSLETRGQYTITVAKNKFNRNAGLTLSDIEGGRNPVQEFSLRYDGVDHYTHPSRFIKKQESNQAEHYLMIDKVLYCIWYCKNDCETFEIQSLYIPLIDNEDAQKKKKKKKGGFLKKLGAKLSTAMGGNAHVLAQNDVNHRAKIKAYLTEMRNLQKAHPYSSEILSEIASIKKDKDEETQAINKFNQDYMNSDEYKEIMKRNKMFDEKDAAEAKLSVNIKNTTGNAVQIGLKGGTSLGSILPGATTAFDCQEDLYIYQGGRASVLIYKANSNCEGLIEI